MELNLRCGQCIILEGCKLRCGRSVNMARDASIQASCRNTAFTKYTCLRQQALCRAGLMKTLQSRSSMHERSHHLEDGLVVVGMWLRQLQDSLAIRAGHFSAMRDKVRSAASTCIVFVIRHSSIGPRPLSGRMP